MAESTDTKITAEREPRLPLLVSAQEKYEDSESLGEICEADFFVRGIGWIEHVAGMWSYNDWETATLDIVGPLPLEFYLYEVLAVDIIAIRWRMEIKKMFSEDEQ